jgi:hypothetical protein
LRYNARGVGLSSGWKSFTGLQEAEDLRELVKYALKRLSNVSEVVLIVRILFSFFFGSPSPPICFTVSLKKTTSFALIDAANDTPETLRTPPETPKQGYSNGALTASLHPVLPAPLRTTHVLISYPLGPRGLLTAFHTRSYQRALEDLVPQPGARILLCQGDADEFTGAEAYDAWAEALGQLAVGGGGDETGEGRPPGAGGEGVDVGVGEGEGEGEGEGWSTDRGGSGLEVVRIPGASHFWGGQARRGLVEAVTQFLT